MSLGLERRILSVKALLAEALQGSAGAGKSWNSAYVSDGLSRGV